MFTVTITAARTCPNLAGRRADVYYATGKTLAEAHRKAAKAMPRIKAKHGSSFEDYRVESEAAGTGRMDSGVIRRATEQVIYNRSI